MADYLINWPFCSDDFIRSHLTKSLDVRKADDQSNSPIHVFVLTLLALCAATASD